MRQQRRLRRGHARLLGGGPAAMQRAPEARAGLAVGSTSATRARGRLALVARPTWTALAPSVRCATRAPIVAWAASPTPTAAPPRRVASWATTPVSSVCRTVIAVPHDRFRSPQDFTCHDGCTSNVNCGGTTPFCNTTDSQCVACLQSTDCPVADPVCNTDRGECAICVMQQRLQGRGRSSICDTQRGQSACVQCVRNSDCPMATPNCNNNVCGA